MYGKFVNDELIEAPLNFKTPNGELIVNFTNSIDLMKAYGFKEITGDKPEYNPDIEALKIVSYEETEDEIVCVYEKIPISSLLATVTTLEETMNTCKAELLDARKTETIVNGVATIKEYGSLKERLKDLEKVVYEKVEITEQEVVITVENNKVYICTNAINSLSLKIPSETNVNFSTKIYFQADKNFTLDNLVFMGDDCESGKLKVEEDNEYVIDLICTNQIIGIVSCSNFVEGDKGNTSDAGDEEGTLHKFTGGVDLIKVAKTYWDNRETYLTHGLTTVLNGEGTLSWSKVTTSGSDSPDGRYRKLDCSSFVNLCLRGIEFDEVLKSKTVYDNKDLSPRLSKYSWATQLGRTSAQMCKDTEDLGWALPRDKWHTDEAKTNWLGLEIGDIIFLKIDEPNGRYKNVGEVCIYYGVDSNGENCIIECSKSNTSKRHSDGQTCGCQIIPFSKKNRANIVTIARCQK